MTRKTSTVAFLVMLTALTPLAMAGDATWVQDYDEALAIAKKEGKDLLVDFTGSDWCGWCIRLNEEVFHTDKFKGWAPDQFVLTMLDFPRGEDVKAKVPNPERNQELQQAWGVQGFPTIMLVSSTGKPYAKTGYQAGGPAAYIEHLQTLKKDGHAALSKLEDLSKAFEGAQGAEKDVVLGKIVDELGGLPEGSPLATSLLAHAEQALVADPDNAKGLKLKAVKALMNAGRADENVVAAAKELDPKNENGLLERIVYAKMPRSEDQVAAFCKAMDELDAVGKIHDADIAKMLYVNAAMMNFHYTGNKDAAKKYAAKAKAVLDEGNQQDARFLQALEPILGGGS